jgi:hypothetical protein
LVDDDQYEMDHEQHGVHGAVLAVILIAYRFCVKEKSPHRGKRSVWDEAMP